MEAIWKGFGYFEILPLQWKSKVKRGMRFQKASENGGKNGRVIGGTLIPPENGESS